MCVCVCVCVCACVHVCMCVVALSHLIIVSESHGRQVYYKQCISPVCFVGCQFGNSLASGVILIFIMQCMANLLIIGPFQLY